MEPRRDAERAPETGGTPPIRSDDPLLQAREHHQRLEEEKKALGRLALAIKPLANEKLWTDLVKARKKVDAQLVKLPESLRAHPAAAWLAGLPEALAARERRLVDALGQDLPVACEAAGVRLRVLSREDPIVLRLVPFELRISRKKVSAELFFAGYPVSPGPFPATVSRILEERTSALTRLGDLKDPAAFFDACRGAWRATRAARGPDGPEQVEILDFLPYLALAFQGRRFAEQPLQKHFADYGRARFAWDVQRLRAHGMLARDGWRLSLGVATGRSASQKKRVLYFEDEEGRGEYKLTITFVREEG